MRLISKNRGDFSEDWSAVPLEQRQLWFKANHDTLGTHMMAKMNSCIQEMQTKTNTKMTTEGGVFIDMEDLQKKYGDKPAQLASIIRMAQTRFDEARTFLQYA